MVTYMYDLIISVGYGLATLKVLVSLLSSMYPPQTQQTDQQFYGCLYININACRTGEFITAWRARLGVEVEELTPGHQAQLKVWITIE